MRFAIRAGHYVETGLHEKHREEKSGRETTSAARDRQRLLRNVRGNRGSIPTAGRRLRFARNQRFVPARESVLRRCVDPNPIGYYPYSYYQGSGFPVGRAVGYYPYPDAHPYVPVPYGFGYGYPFGYGYFGNPYGFGYFGYPYGYSAVPFFGYPGWGTVSPYGFGF